MIMSSNKHSSNLVLLFAVVLNPSVVAEVDSKDSEAIAPAVVAALIGAGVVVVGGTVAFINDQSDDVQAHGVAVGTSPDFARCGGGHRSGPMPRRRI